MENVHLLNQILAPVDDELTRSFTAPEKPVIAVVGLPRGGKSFVQQYLISVSDIGYISNVQAKFYKAPYIGAMIEKEFMETDYLSNQEHFYGITFGPLEPNEWGWFWNHWLKVKKNNYYIEDESSIDFEGLNRKLAGMEHVKGNSILFQNVYATINLEILARHIPNLMVVYVSRDPLYLVNSYVRGKTEIKDHAYTRKNKGNYGEMIYFRPEGFDAHSPRGIVEESAVSIKLLSDHIERQLAFLPSSKIIRVDFDRAKADPRSFFKTFSSVLEKNGGALTVKKENYEKCLSFPPRNREEYLLKDYREEIERSVAKFFC